MSELLASDGLSNPVKKTSSHAKALINVRRL